MDANGTRFHLLLGKDDWGACAAVLDGGDPVTLAPDWDLAGPSRPPFPVAWDHEQNELTLAPRLFQFSPPVSEAGPGLAARRGAGADAYGNRYWIDDDERTILVRSAGTGGTAKFWRAGDGVACDPAEAEGDFRPAQPPVPAPLRLRGLAVTRDHYLVVGALDPPGLLVFDLHAGGPPAQVAWPASVPFAPFDMAPARDGGVHILDRDPAR